MIAGLIWFLFCNLVPWGSVLERDYTAPPTTLITMSVGDPVGRAIKLSLLGIAILVVLWRRALAYVLALQVNIYFLIFIAMIPLSALWSIDRSATIARFVSVICNLSVCFAFGLTSWHPQRFQNVVRPVLTFLLAASIVFGIIWPNAAIMPGEGTLKNAWQGLFDQKNIFGQTASFGIILWGHAWTTGEVKWWKGVIGLGISTACVLLSRSSTSLLASIFGSMFLLMFISTPPNIRRYMPFMVVLFGAVIITYAVAVLRLVPGLDMVLAPITLVTGKDTTFSARSIIWEIIKEHIELSPILGSGYGAYWVGPLPQSPSSVFLSRMYGYPTESHNGYIEVVNDLGVIGFIVLFGFLVTYIRQALQLTRIHRGQGALFLALIFQQSLINLSESCWFQINAPLSFTMMNIATISLGRALLEQRFRAHFGTNGSPSAGVSPASRVPWRPPRGTGHPR